MTREEILRELTKLHEQELQHLRSLVIIRDKRNLLMSVDAQHGEQAEAAAQHREERRKAADAAMATKTNISQTGKVLKEEGSPLHDATEPNEPETREDGKSKCLACSKWFKDLAKHQTNCSYLKKLDEGPSEDEIETPDDEDEVEESEDREIDLGTLSKAFGELAKTDKKKALEILHSFGVKTASQLNPGQRVEAFDMISEARD